MVQTVMYLQRVEDAQIIHQMAVAEYVIAH